MKYRITIDKNAGFCFGVDRAVKMVYDAAWENNGGNPGNLYGNASGGNANGGNANGENANGENTSGGSANSGKSGNANPGNVYTYGEIIHNAHVVLKFADMGVRVIGREDFGYLSEKDTVVIRSHGVSAADFCALEKTGAKIADGTCPFVTKIHNIVREKSSEGYTVVIFGDKNHDEIKGIVGNCQNIPLVYDDYSAFFTDSRTNPDFFQKKLAFLSQTTYNILEWECIINRIQEEFPTSEIFNTVCHATSERQASAKELAVVSDIIVTVGDRKSSNTRKLFEICSRFGRESLFCDGFLGAESKAQAADAVKTAQSRNRSTPGKTLTVGITAGASTPCEVIEEVKIFMEDIIKGAQPATETELNENMSFEELLDATMGRRVHKGSRVTGIITGFHNNEVTVDIGTKHTGFVPLEEFSDIPDEDPRTKVAIGSEVELVVTQVNDAEGWVALSKSKADAKSGFDRLAKAKENDEIIDAVVTEIVNGGVVTSVKGARVFIPASHSGVRTSRTEDKPGGDLSVLYKKTVKIKLIEVDEKRNKAVGSIREALAKERSAAKDTFWASAEVGKTYEGEVRSLTSYGAFVDLGGVDGMVHLSELSWDKVTHPSQVVKVGQKITVYIKALDPEKNRISLGYKNPSEDPYTKFTEEYSVGMDIPVKIVSIASFGAFAQIIPGVDGLIHISQVSNNRVTNAGDVLKKDDEVTARITEIDLDKKRISLSIRAILEESEAETAGDSTNEVVYEDGVTNPEEVAE
jgi:4-hydroxy-3-methylbut-2-enyl diphosphate reductase